MVYLSSNGGDRALTPPRRHCLGRPLPYQQADTAQAAPQAPELYCIDQGLNDTDYRVLARVSPGYSQLEGTLPTCYYPVCQDVGRLSTCMPYPRRQRSS